MQPDYAFGTQSALARFDRIPTIVRSVKDIDARAQHELFYALVAAHGDLKRWDYMDHALDILVCAYDLHVSMKDADTLDVLDRLATTSEDVAETEEKCLAYRELRVSVLKRAAGLTPRQRSERLAKALSDLGHGLLNAKYPLRAWQAFREQESINRALRTEFPDESRWAVDTTTILQDIAVAGMQTFDKRDDAVGAATETINLLSADAKSTTSLVNRTRLLEAHWALGEAAWQYTGNFDYLTSQLIAGRAIANSLAARDPSRYMESQMYAFLWNFTRAWDDRGDALAAAGPCVEIARKVADDNPEDRAKLKRLGDRLQWAARVHASAARTEVARSLYVQFLSLYQSLAADPDSGVEEQRNLASAHEEVMNFYFRCDDVLASKSHMNDALRIREDLALRRPWAREEIFNLLAVQNRALYVARVCGFDEHDGIGLRLQARFDGIVGRKPDLSPREMWGLIDVAEALAADAIALKRVDATAECVKTVCGLVDAAAYKSETSVKCRVRRPEARELVAMQLARSGQFSEARRLLDEAEFLWRDLVDEDPEHILLIEGQADLFWMRALIALMQGDTADTIDSLRTTADLYKKRRTLGAIPPNIDRCERRVNLALDACVKHQSDIEGVTGNELDDCVVMCMIAVRHAAGGRLNEALETLRLARQAAPEDAGLLLGEIAHYATLCLEMHVVTDDANKIVGHEATRRDLQNLAIGCITSPTALTVVDGFGFLEDGFYDCLRSAPNYAASIQGIAASASDAP